MSEYQRGVPTPTETYPLAVVQVQSTALGAVSLSQPATLHFFRPREARQIAQALLAAADAADEG
jgi:hypothetical protein